jgi:hypothetical protein
MTATTPNTQGTLQALQSLILANTGTTFAALGSADATRYGVTRAVYIGAPKDFKDRYLPQCHIVPVDDRITITGEQARVNDAITCEVRCIADYTDWWAAEQQILTIRDVMVPLLATHLRAGATAGGNLMASSIASVEDRGAFSTIEVAEVWYRSWSCLVMLEQVYVPSGGFVG